MRQIARHWLGHRGRRWRTRDGGIAVRPGRRTGRAGAGVVCTLSGILALGPVAAVQTHSVDPATGIESWEISVTGVSVSLTQILPDQLRAFYLNRGFSAATIEPYARSCVYMTVLRNDAADGVVRFRQTDWRVVAGTEVRPVVSTEAWLERLRPARPTPAAMIAFRWAQFPSAHAYQPGGDWNQGMLSVGLPPAATFDLIVRWEVEGRHYEGEFKDVRCAREDP